MTSHKPIVIVGVLAGMLLFYQSAYSQNVTCDFTYFQVNEDGVPRPTGSGGLNSSDTVVGFWQMADTNLAAFARTASGKITTYLRPGYGGTNFAGINDAGVIVGSSGQALFAGTGFIIQNGKIANINYPGALETDANGINNQNAIVGTYWDTNYDTHGFLWQNGKYQDISYPGSNFTNLSAINDQGVMVGTFSDNQSLPHIHGFVYTNGKFQRVDFKGLTTLYDTTLTSINDNNTIVGWFEQTDNSPGVAFVYENGTFKVLSVPQSTNTGAAGINRQGDICRNRCSQWATARFLGEELPLGIDPHCDCNFSHPLQKKRFQNFSLIAAQLSIMPSA